MIGILLITHYTMGESLFQTACHVLNKRPRQVAQLGVLGQDDPLDLMPVAQTMVEQLDTGEGVLILTDVFGATPANVAAKIVARGRVEAVAGVNLPMLIRALTYRERDMETLVVKTVAGGRDGVMRMER